MLVSDEHDRMVIVKKLKNAALNVGFSLAFVGLLGAAFVLRFTPNWAREGFTRAMAHGARVAGLLVKRDLNDQYRIAEKASGLVGPRRPILEIYSSSIRMLVEAMWMMAAPMGSFHKLFRDDLDLDVDLAQVRMAQRNSPTDGAVVVFPHLGSHRAIVPLLALNGIKTAVVAKYKSGGVIEKVLKYSAKRADVKLIQVDPKSDTGGVVEKSADAVRQGYVVTIAGDAYTQRKNVPPGGVLIEMAGTMRRIGTGPAAVSLLTDTPIVCAAIYQFGDQREAHFRPMIKPSSIYKRLATSGEVTEHAPATDERGVDPRAVQLLTTVIGSEMSHLILAAPSQWSRIFVIGKQTPVDAPGTRPRTGSERARVVEYLTKGDERWSVPEVAPTDDRPSMGPKMAQPTRAARPTEIGR